MTAAGLRQDVRLRVDRILDAVMHRVGRIRPLIRDGFRRLRNSQLLRVDRHSRAIRIEIAIASIGNKRRGRDRINLLIHGGIGTNHAVSDLLVRLVDIFNRHRVLSNRRELGNCVEITRHLVVRSDLHKRAVSLRGDIAAVRIANIPGVEFAAFPGRLLRQDKGCIRPDLDVLRRNGFDALVIYEEIDLVILRAFGNVGSACNTPY